MFYRIHIVMALPDRDMVNDIMDKAMDTWGKAGTINPGTPQSEPSFIQIERCYHDEDIPRPCEQVHYIETPP